MLGYCVRFEEAMNTALADFRRQNLTFIDVRF